MKILNTIWLLIRAAYLATETTAQLKFIIDGKTVGGILKSLNLDSTQEEWPNRMQLEGLGGIISVIHRLRKMSQDTTIPLEEFLAQHSIVSFGGFNGNLLDCLITSLIGSALGLQGDVWIIQDEVRPEDAYVPQAGAIVKQLLKIIQDHPEKFPRIKLLNTQSFDRTLEDEFPEIRDLKRRITDPTSPEDKKKAIDTIMKKSSEYTRAGTDGKETNEKYCPYRNVNIKNYSLVLDGITGTSQDKNELKIGTVWSVDMMKDAEAEDAMANRLLSMDYPSLWLNGKKKMLPVYEEFDLKPLNPGSLVNVHSKKLFALGDDCNGMTQYVATLKRMEVALENKTALDILASFSPANNPYPYVTKLVADIVDPINEDKIDPKDINISVDIDNARLARVHSSMITKNVNSYAEYVPDVKQWFVENPVA